MVARAGGTFVGRARELGELERVLAASRAGIGSTVLLAGDAGIGKTRLAAELAGRARAAGVDVLVGRSIDVVGTELPYQPFIDALRPLGKPGLLAAPTAVSRLEVFEATRALIAGRADATPLLLVLEDLHWADASTLDLVVFLAHNLHDRAVLLLGTYRADEPSSVERTRRLAEGVRRSGSALVLAVGPLGGPDLVTLLAARAQTTLSPALENAIVARSEGNPFFAEELLAAQESRTAPGELPPGLRDVLLRRVARLDRPTQGLLRLAAAAGRDIGYPLLRDAAHLPEHAVSGSLRHAVEHGVLVADQAAGTFRFRHALLAEAVYSTILPGEREELHAGLADALARSGTASPAELAPHWTAAGRTREALVASVEAAEQAQAVFGLGEALTHLERALALWEAVPDAAELARVDRAEICARAAQLASQVSASPRAVELARWAIALVGADDPGRACLLHVRLGEYLYQVGSNHSGLETLGQAVEIAPSDPQSAERAYALASLAGGLMIAWRYAESLPISRQALRLARDTGAREAEVRAVTVLAGDLCYLGRTEEGLAHFRDALRLAEEIGDHWGLDRVYVNLTDALILLGRIDEAARLGRAGIEALRRYGIDSAVLVANTVEALLAAGEWDEAERRSAAALRAVTGGFPYMLHMLRADLELGRGQFEAARSHLDAALTTLREDRGLGVYDEFQAELAYWERRFTDADQAVRDALAMARSGHTAPLRVRFCAKGLRAQAELAALARARRDADAERTWRAAARRLVAGARRAAAQASTVTPDAARWLALAEAEYARVRGGARPEPWSTAADAWDRAGRLPLAAYCRWREAEALVAAGASRAAAGVPLRRAHQVAARIGAVPLLRELELLAQRARLDLAEPAGPSPAAQEGLAEVLGLTAREAEVLTLVARGCTNREIAAALVISVKTANVHVSHILGKLGTPNRREAAAIAHRLTPPPIGL